MRQHPIKMRGHWCSMTAGLALALLWTAPGHAVSLTVGDHYQESSNVTSTSPPSGSACNNTIFCFIIFNKVLTGKQLIITQVSCALSVSTSAAQAVSMYLGPRRPTGTAVERFQILIPSTMPSNQPGYNLVLNSNAYQLFTTSDRPEIYIGLNASANILGFCSISGQMVDRL
jgi:hypothetical protein